MSLKNKVDKLKNNLQVRFLRIRIIKNIRNNNSLLFLRRKWVETIYFIIFISLTAGMMNTILEGYVRDSSIGQNISQTIAYMIIMLLGTGAIYLTYISNSQGISRRIGNFYFIFGIILIFLTTFIGYSIK